MISEGKSQCLKVKVILDTEELALGTWEAIVCHVTLPQCFYKTNLRTSFEWRKPFLCRAHSPESLVL